MHNKTFAKPLDQLKKLTPSQKEKLQSTLHHTDSGEKVSAVIDTIESCPHYTSKSYQKWGVRSSLQRYRCNDCHKTFNALTRHPTGKTQVQRSMDRLCTRHYREQKHQSKCQALWSPQRHYLQMETPYAQ